MYKIAISGKINVGKNTVANLFVNELNKIKNNPIVKLMAFADPIKEMALLMFPQINREYLFGPSKLRSSIIEGATTADVSKFIGSFQEDIGMPLTCRQLLLELGTKGRDYRENVWVENFDFRYKEILLNNPDLLIVSDVRFRNEFDYLKSQGFFQIRLLRNTGQKEINHLSEKEQNNILDSEFNFIMHNDTTLEDLSQNVSKIFNSIVV